MVTTATIIFRRSKIKIKYLSKGGIHGTKIMFWHGYYPSVANIEGMTCNSEIHCVYAFGVIKEDAQIKSYFLNSLL